MKEKKYFFWQHNDRKKIEVKSLVQQLMPVLGLLILLLGIGSGAALYVQHRDNLHQHFSETTAELQYDMQVQLQYQTSALSMTLKTIVQDPKVQQSLRNRDGNALLMQWQDVFQKMKAENKLTHFYFMDKNRVCLVRVHNPSKKGDIIDRFTAQESEWSRKLSSGVEVGPMGMLTLRVVQPVIVNNELIGYVEMGKEIEDVLQTLHLKSNIDLIMVLRKEIVEKSRWEEGMRSLNREPNWELFGKDVLYYSSFEQLPTSMVDYFKTELNTHNHYQLNDELSSLGNTYRVSLIPFKDVTGREVGDLILLQNITNENIEFFNNISIGLFLGGFIVALMLGVVYLILRHSDDRIDNQQQHLFESQQRLQQLAFHSRTIAWEVDSEGRYTYVSNVVYDVLGYTSEELVGKYFYDLHPLSGREIFKEKAFEVIKRKESFTNLKNSALGKGGEVVWLLTNAIPLIDSNGKLLGYRGNDTDITAWQKAEDAIIESRNLLNTIIDTIPIRVFWKSKTLRYLGCNTLFARDAGLQNPSELVGKDDYQMGWAEQADMYRADDRSVMESGESKLFFIEDQTTAQGDKIWLSTSKVPLRNHEGKVIGILGTYEDVTEQKQMQEELRHNAQMLNEAQKFARMGSWTLDLIHHKLVWSDEVFGVMKKTSG